MHIQLLLVGQLCHASDFALRAPVSGNESYPFISSYHQELFGVSEKDNGEVGESRHRNRLKYVHSIIGGGVLVYFIYGYFVFWDDATFDDFTVSPINNDHQWNYAGGSDKFSHAFGGYFITRTSSQLYKWAGLSQKKAAFYGFSWAQSLLFLGELEDGFTIKYGFDPVDLGCNILGGILGYCEEIFPGFDATFDFRIAYWPSREYREAESFDNIAEDYSGQQFFGVFRPSGLLKNTSQYSFLRFAEIYIGYGSRGYMPGDRRAYEDQVEEPERYVKKREILAGISLDLKEVIHLLWGEDTEDTSGMRKVFLSSSDFFFEYYQHPIKIP